jgi:sugar porter (SP) family MFS transporter
MPGGAVFHATTDVNRIEAPVTWKAYAMCIFASFGGIFFGYDSGYIGGVQGMTYFIETIDPGREVKLGLKGWQASLIVSILSAGTFFGAIIAGDLADMVGRRTTILAGCAVFLVGAILQTASHGLGLLVAGRLIAGFGIGFVSAIIILYMSEIAPRKVRGAIVAGYQFCVTIGLLLAACVTYATENRTDSGSYRIPTAIQMLWAIILAIGLFILPESPRYFVKRGKLEKARNVLARVRGQPESSEFVETELAEIIANAEYERTLTPSGGYFQSWFNCFTGSVFNANSNLRRTILGTSLQMMQQWTGVNFIFYFSTPFLQSTGAIKNSFLISLIFTLVNVCSTPISFWSIEKFGRRPLLIWGAAGMTICQFIVAIVGVTVGFNNSTTLPDGTTHANNIPAVNAQIAFICFYIFFFASTWGPGAWVVIGEIYPLPIRSRGVALSTASNWLWNCIISVITPYLVKKGPGYANLRSSVFFLWGSLCACCFVYAYLLVSETKGLTLEQVDRMMEETTPRTSAKWKPHSTFASDMGISEKGTLEEAIVVDVERKGSVV